MESQRLRVFRAGWLHANAQFNEGNLEDAWGAMAADFEYRPPSNFPSPPVLRGPDQIIDYFRSVRKALPDSRGEPLEFLEAGDGRILVHVRMSGAAPRTDAEGESDLFQVWEFEGDRPVRVREFTDHHDAYRSAGLDD